VRAGQRVEFAPTYQASHLPAPARLDTDRAEQDTEAF